MLTFKQYISLLEAQEYTSEDTSRNQVPAGIKFAIQKGLIQPDTISVDHGGGKYDLAQKTVQKNIPNASFFTHDPYNRSSEHNEYVRSQALGSAHYVGLHNVLNVIKEPEERINALHQMKQFLHPDGTAHITVYTGGQQKGQPAGVTKDGWQERRPTKSYIPEIQQVFSPDEYNVKTYGEHILVSKKQLPKALPTVNEFERYRQPGKKVGNSLYLHKDYIHTLPTEDQEIVKQRLSSLPEEFKNKFNIVKLQDNNGSKVVSYINSPDFDESDEPISGDSYAVHPTGKVTITRQKLDPQIYHHKWQWVGDDYQGFDVNESKARSKSYENLLKHIATTEDPKVKQRIGTRSYWINNILSRLI